MHGGLKDRLMQPRSLTIIQCNASLEVIHSHLVRAAHLDEGTDWAISYPAWVSERVIRTDFWTFVLPGCDTRPEYGEVVDRIQQTLSNLRKTIRFAMYSRIHLVVSDLSWLMNNVLLTTLSRFCRRHKIEFALSLLDEGSVLYTGARFGLRRSLRSAAKYMYLRLHGLPASLILPGNVDYFNPLCGRIYCLHSQLLKVPGTVAVEEIRTELLESVYGDVIPALPCPPRSCLYLSQPLYKLVGADRQLAVVRSCIARLSAEGIKSFYYKPHHADLPFWCELIEKECGLRQLEFRESVPIELLASRCTADVVVSHSTSALLNLRRYGYKGRVLAYGLPQLRGSFREQSQYDSFLHMLNRMDGVEMIDADDGVVPKIGAACDR